MPPTRPQPVSKAFLTRTLNRNFAFTPDCDGDLYKFLAGKRPGEGLQCWVVLEKGQTCTILQLTCLVQPIIPWERLPDALIATNHYNEGYRFGKLYVTPADEEKAGVSLRFKGEIDVSSGVSEEFLATFVASHLASICDFLSQLFEDKELFGSRKPKSLRKRSAAGKSRKTGGNSGKRKGGEE